LAVFVQGSLAHMWQTDRQTTATLKAAFSFTGRPWYFVRICVASSHKILRKSITRYRIMAKNDVAGA